MKHLWIKRTIQIIGCVVLFSIIAWAQKDEALVQEGLTLTDLGVTAEQKTQIEVMWKLKRQKHLDAVKELKTLNRLVKDSLIGDEEIRKTLENFRSKRKELQTQIDKSETKLIEVLSPRAQLHLTVLGVLENGLPRRILKTQKDKSAPEKSSDAASPTEKPAQ